MGKMFTYLSILLFVDVLFIITGQQVLTISSTFINSILNLESLTLGSFVGELLGNFKDLFNSSTGLWSLITGAAVTATLIFTSSDLKITIPLGITLGVIGADFVGIWVYLNALNPILAMLIMGPMSILYIVTVVEWMLRKD
jgi:hypothetical protein